MAEQDQTESPEATEKPAGDNPEQTFPEPEKAEPLSGVDATAELTDLGQKIIDISLGTVVVAGELTIQAARLISEHGPQILENLESKGRPVREQIDDWLKNAFTSPFKETTEETKNNSDETSADDEISALERRVRELEEQVKGVPGEAEPVPPVPPVVSAVLPDLDDIPVSDSKTVVEESTLPTTNTVENDKSETGSE